MGHFCTEILERQSKLLGESKCYTSVDLASETLLQMKLNF